MAVIAKTLTTRTLFKICTAHLRAGGIGVGVSGTACVMIHGWTIVPPTVFVWKVTTMHSIAKVASVFFSYLVATTSTVVVITFIASAITVVFTINPTG